MMKQISILYTVIVLCLFSLFFLMTTTNSVEIKEPVMPYVQGSPSVSPSPSPILLPVRKVIPNFYYIKQSFNNCGPASLSMALSYFDIEKSQEEIGQALRPYQNPQGDNDDKSVTLTELANHAKKYDLLTYHKPNGSIEMLKQFLAQDIPVLTRTWLHINEDIGHYRVIKGYDDENKIIIQDDSYEGPNISFSYEDFNNMWSKFDYEYLVLIPKNKQTLAEKIIGENLDDKIAWKTAAKRNEEDLKNNPGDIYTTFNLSVAYYNMGEYEKSIREFEKVEKQLPFRTLWYQIEPIMAYYKAQKYDRVMTITERILTNQNRAYSELYILRGNIYKAQGNYAAARTEYEKAVYYNQNLTEAKDALSSL